jgi:hypothetical protein
MPDVKAIINSLLEVFSKSENFGILLLVLLSLSLLTVMWIVLGGKIRFKNLESKKDIEIRLLKIQLQEASAKNDALSKSQTWELEKKKPELPLADSLKNPLPKKNSAAK